MTVTMKEGVAIEHFHFSSGDEARFVSFDQHIESDRAMAQLERMGYVAAKIDLFLQLATQYPNHLNEYAAVYLGSIVVDSHGEARVPVVYLCDGVWRIDLLWYDGGWAKGTRFAGVLA